MMFACGPSTPGGGADMRVELYQIAYSAQTLAMIEPGYRVLDNLSNERPDWYEYHPIRRFLLEQPLEDDVYYGFFSPKFASKTGLAHPSVVEHVLRAGPGVDVVLFSPQPDMGAFFLNVFEQAETFDAGFIDAATAWLDTAGLIDTRKVSLRSVVMDARHTVFSNYFVAKAAFWREWARFNEALFRLCEEGPEPLRALLIAPTSYAGGAQRKVFLQERTASLLLALQDHWRSHSVNPFDMAWSKSRFRQHPQTAFMSDALKRVHRDLGHPSALKAFARLRERFLDESTQAADEAESDAATA